MTTPTDKRHPTGPSTAATQEDHTLRPMLTPTTPEAAYAQAYRRYQAGEGVHPGGRAAWTLAWRMAQAAITVPELWNTGPASRAGAASSGTAGEESPAPNPAPPPAAPLPPHTPPVIPTTHHPTPYPTPSTAPLSLTGHPTPSQEDPVLDLPSEDPVVVVFKAWLAATGKSANRTVLSEVRRRLIRRALHDYPLADVVAAVRGWRHSPYHNGDNPQVMVYNHLELLLRDAARIEAFRDLELAADRVPLPPRREDPLTQRAAELRRQGR